MGEYMKRSEYISREAALSEACKGCGIDFPCDPCESQDCEIKARLEAIPAADVVEVRHERWDLAKDPFGAGYVKCSRCGYKHCPEYYPDGSAIMHLFCPNCGAKMDGGQDDV